MSTYEQSPNLSLGAGARLNSPHPLRAQVEALPYSPGVYFMKAADGSILYIGKAKSLRQRVRSYLAARPEIPKIPILMAKVRKIEYIETPAEVDALLLEAQLIRKYQPHYNKELKDDKSFPLLKITAEPFPRLLMTRNQSDRKAIYYGPYTDARLLREAVSLVHALFPIRKCRRLPKTACLYYHIGQCIAPCIKPEVKEEYDRLIREVRSFLGGGKKSFMDYLKERMEEASKELRFEDAQYYKEQMDALAKLRRRRFTAGGEDLSAGLSATLELKKWLAAEKPPERIVCFDVSNIQGAEAVASRVSFYREMPEKSGYRRYKIRRVQGINDYAMIQEALERMLEGIREKREKFIPDVIMIDGGKGHLGAALQVLKRMGAQKTKLISIAKRFETIYTPGHDSSGEPEGALMIPMPKDSPALYLLQKIRDEAHHFAITYHRTLKGKNLTESIVDEVPGIGPARKRLLLERYASVEALSQATAGELAALGIHQATAHKLLEHLLHCLR